MSIISFEPHSYIYRNELAVTDPNEVCGYGKSFSLKYSDVLHLSKAQTKLGIFGTSKGSSGDDLFAHSRSKQVITFANLTLFPCMTIHDLLEVVALSLKLNITQIVVEFVEQGVLYRNEVDVEGTSSLITYMRTASIGFSKIRIHVETSKLPPMTFADNTFYENYSQVSTYVGSLLQNCSRQKVSSIDVQPIISALSVILVNKNAKTNVDISRLFNMHHAGRKYSKIYIQSKRVDESELNEREMQYVKMCVNTDNPFNGVQSLYETCSLYVGEEALTGMVLTSIDICTNTTITLNFIVVGNELRIMSYDELKTLIMKWLDANLKRILDDTEVDECVYDITFKTSDYKPSIGAITIAVSIPNGTIDDVGEVNAIMNQTIPSLRFSTKTSVQFASYAFESVVSRENFKYVLVNKEFITENVMQHALNPTVHIGYSIGTNVLTITAIRANSIEEAYYHFSMTIGAFGTLNISNSSSNTLSEVKTFKEIQSRATKMNKKQLLKILNNSDPTLFGSRKVGRSIRPYSGLAQQQEQRVVPITKNEYDIIRKERPHSVANVENQTFKSQRLYLFCPHDRTQYINFHSIPNQLCIPRCTTKLSNRAQLMYCVKSLNIEGVEVEEGIENQSITLYNPIISRGRRCKLPSELINVFPGYICIKLNVDLGNVDTYYHDKFKDKRAFIIKRDALLERYEIWTEYNKGEDYILTIFAERTQNDAFMVTDGTKPFLFSENEGIRKFFEVAAVKSEAQLLFFNFVESILNKNLGDLYSLSTSQILSSLHTKFNIKLCIRKNIVFGFIHDGKLYFSPKFYWSYKKGNAFMEFAELRNAVVKQDVELPTLTDFDEKSIAEIYVDYATEMIRAIKYKNITIFVKSIDKNRLFRLPKIQFDFNTTFISSIDSVVRVDEDEEDDEKTTRRQYASASGARELLYTYLFVYFVHTINRTGIAFDKNDFGKFIIDNGYARDKEEKILGKSWRRSYVSKNTLKGFIDDLLYIDNYNITEIIYNQIQRTLKLNIKDDERLYMKIIT